MITVLMGAPGAGKSTWVVNNKTGSEHVFNTEGVRVNRELDVAAYMQHQRVKAIKAVETGKSLIADGTHTIDTHRKVWLNLAKRLGLETRLVIFDTALPTLLAVQTSREFPAPRNVVVDHHRRLQMAKHIVTKEGWNCIETIKR
jgi:predicted kinase